ILLGAPQPSLTLAQEMGVADEVIDVLSVSAEERIARVLALTEHGVGADVVFETAGVPSAFIEGLEMLRKMGTFAEVGNLIDTGATAQLNIARLITSKAVNLFGVVSQPPQTMVKALKTMEITGKRFDYKRLVTAQFNVTEALDAVRLAQDPVEKGIKIVLRGAGFQ
ncbi:MAG: zinc-binding dehydrogenase, partial [Dehalococcoidales bacterium]|nr:zinc-binding dehydrogenase [Dehalococcoidales bacterium]